MKITLQVAAALSLLAVVAPLRAQAPAARVDASAPVVKAGPDGQPNAAFIKMHESFLARGKAGPIGVLFLGDSITAGWTPANGSRAHIWDTYFGKMQPANFGIGGDQTQHVIWRIANGELDGISPKVVVLMLGTNNTGPAPGGHTAAEIAAADKKIVQLIREKTGAKVLLLAVFPRGARKDQQGVIQDSAITDAARRTEIINAVNRELAKLDDGKNVRYLDINHVFLGQDGKIPFSIMPDQLHPNTAGYQLWADAMKPLLTEMMK